MDENTIIEYQRTIMRLKLEKFISYNLFMDYNPDIRGDVIIYGAGQIGKLLFRCFDRRPIAFIDAKQGLSDICGVPIYCVDTCTDRQITNDCTVIVTPIWAYESISQKVMQINSLANIISLEKLVEKL